ncbi:hypothetical protein EJ02DRAFT_456908 [Clathrospora elynae]|uniref:Uncharacterized protein n=1 Tax=Clathrospora elynae TaxID=706981 RepID=A0A6A5SFT5_9PLEO|nr:hypothetical protein EJ02DRAFT_456908 [Clathrospora elynae]
MKASIIITAAATLFSSASLAAPTTTRSADALVFKVQLTNDITGANANGDIIVNNPAISLGLLFGQPGSRLFATSLQAVSPGAGGNNIACVVKNPAVASQVFPLNAWNTFIDLDGNPNQAIQTDVTDFTIECQL